MVGTHRFDEEFQQLASILGYRNTRGMHEQGGYSSLSSIFILIVIDLLLLPDLMPFKPSS